MKDKRQYWVSEQSGVPIHPIPDGVDDIGACANARTLKHTLLSERESLKKGMRILAPSMSGSYVPAVVRTIEPAHAVDPFNERMTYFLQYNTERGCWACVGSGNIQHAQKLELGLDVPEEETEPVEKKPEKPKKKKKPARRRTSSKSKKE